MTARNGAGRITCDTPRIMPRYRARPLSNHTRVGFCGLPRAHVRTRTCADCGKAREPCAPSTREHRAAIRESVVRTVHGDGCGILVSLAILLLTVLRCRTEAFPPNREIVTSRPESKARREIDATQANRVRRLSADRRYYRGTAAVRREERSHSFPVRSNDPQLGQPSARDRLQRATHSSRLPRGSLSRDTVLVLRGYSTTARPTSSVSSQRAEISARSDCATSATGNRLSGLPRASVDLLTAPPRQRGGSSLHHWCGDGASTKPICERKGGIPSVRA
jgi:hypothetical protein